MSKLVVKKMKTKNSLRVAGILLALGLLSYTDDLTRSNIEVESEFLRKKNLLKRVGDSRKQIASNDFDFSKKKIQPHQDY